MCDAIQTPGSVKGKRQAITWWADQVLGEIPHTSQHVKHNRSGSFDVEVATCENADDGQENNQRGEL